MASPRPQRTSKRKQPIAKSRLPIERVIIWSGIGLLSLVAVFESTSLYFYNTTLRKLQATIPLLEVGPDAGVPVADLNQAIHGFCFRNTEIKGQPASKAPNGGAGQARTLLLRWPSLFRTMQLRVSVTEADRAVGVIPEFGAPSPAEAPRKDWATAPSPGATAPLGLARVSNEVVALSTDEMPVEEELRKRRFGSLVRELLRQSFLISARDEMKLFTLDESLGEISFVTTNPQAFPFQINVKLKFGSSGVSTLIADVSRWAPDGKKWTWTSTAVQLKREPSLNELTEALEALSRDQFVSALTSAGYHAQSVPAEAPPAISEDLESQLDVVSQYALIKQLHALRRQQGDTMENLAALSGAYARLGSLVEYHWGPMSKVCYARSLLYAQRMQSKFGKSCASLAQRAYSWALAGNLKLAEQDLTAARQLDRDPSTAPEWAKIVDQYCHYQPAPLGQVTGRQRSLALYFRMKSLVAEQDEQSLIVAIEELLLESPGCTRAIQRMCEMTALGPLRSATEGATVPVWKALYEQLSEISALPPDAQAIVTQELLRTRGRERLAEQKTLLGLNQSLRQTTAESNVSVEPSWSLLAEIFSNENFHQTLNVMIVSQQKLGFPQEHIEEMYQSILPGVKGHRFENYLLRFRADSAATVAGMAQLYKNTKSIFFEILTLPMAYASHGAPDEIYNRWHQHIDNHLDSLQLDLLGAIYSSWDYWQNDGWKFLREVCPHHPLAISRQISITPELETAKEQELEEKYSDNAYLLCELARKYKHLKREDDAIRCLKKSLKVSPNHDTYFELAALYSEREDFEESIQILKSSLDLPSLGLEAGQANNRIAHILMSQGRWKEARPYASAAASTYSGWGLLTSARCEEALKNWKGAEQLYRATSERYDSSADDWYWWCVRTGRGNIKEARQHLEKFRSKYQLPLAGGQIWDRGCEQLLNNDVAGAIATFGAKGDSNHQSFSLMLLAAVLAERQGDLAQRDALYETIRSSSECPDAVARMGRIFRLSQKDSDRFHWREALFLQFADAADESWIPFFYYCAGEFLLNHNQKELALKYLQTAATGRNHEVWSGIVATMALRRLNERIGEQRIHVSPDERAKGIKFMHKSFYASSHNKRDEARALLTEAIESIPDFIAGLNYRGLLNEDGRDAEAAADYEACLKIDPDCELVLFNLAGVRASSHVDEVRNGSEALRCALRSAELSESPKAANLRMIALAYAECGDFPKAVENMEKAVKQEPDNQKWAAQLEILRGGKPYRRPATDVR